VKRLLVIPAAGRGSRLGTSTPKPLVQVNGRSMLDHLATLYEPFVDAVVVVAHPSFVGDVRQWAAGRRGHTIVTEQPEPTGMLDAVCLATPFVRDSQPDAIWITWADQVGILAETLQRLADAEITAPLPALTLPTAMSANPYTHFERDANGRMLRLLQRRENDRMPASGESDIGLFALRRETFEIDLQTYARDVAAGSGTGERNFVPFVPWLARTKEVRTIPSTDPMERVGINTPQELEQVSAWLRTRKPAS